MKVGGVTLISLLQHRGELDDGCFHHNWFNDHHGDAKRGQLPSQPVTERLCGKLGTGVPRHARDNQEPCRAGDVDDGWTKNKQESPEAGSTKPELFCVRRRELFLLPLALLSKGRNSFVTDTSPKKLTSIILRYSWSG